MIKLLESFNKNYLLGPNLGQGSYGTVFLATCRSTNEVVAVKKLKITARDEGLSHTTLREIALLMGIKDRHLIAIKAISFEESQIFIVLELMQQDLKKFIDDTIKEGERSVRLLKVL